jgi:adenosylcobinamide-GDP ribazoletransferase
MARKEGMGNAFAADLTNSVLAVALIVPIVLLLITSPNWQGLIAVILAHVACALICWSARRRLGGVTGDVFGLVVETGELTILLTYAAIL